MNRYPGDWPAMRQAVFDWARAVLRPQVSVYWSRVDVAPSPVLPRVRLSVVSPAVARGQDEIRSGGLWVIVTDVASDTIYEAEIGASLFAFGSGPSPTAETIRDGLLAAIDAGSEPVTVTAYGTDRIILELEAADLAVSVGLGLALKERTLILGDRMMTIGVDVMTDQGDYDDASVLLEDLRGSLENPEHLAILQAGGWVVRGIEGTRKGDVSISAAWQSRSGFDLRLGCRSLAVGTADFIETVEVSSGLPGGP